MYIEYVSSIAEETNDTDDAVIAREWSQAIGDTRSLVNLPPLGIYLNCACYFFIPNTILSSVAEAQLVKNFVNVECDFRELHYYTKKAL